VRRRTCLAGVAALAGCSVLPQQPYLERRDWPLAARRPKVLPSRSRGLVLLVRSIEAGPGLERRGLQWKLPDGSLHIDFYEQWAVPPAQAVEDALRLWLADSGLFAAVVSPGSQLAADLVLEGELTEFTGYPRAGIARAELALVLLDQRPKMPHIMLQKTESVTAPLTSTQPPSVVQSLQAALGGLLRETEQDIAHAAAVLPD